MRDLFKKFIKSKGFKPLFFLISYIITYLIISSYIHVLESTFNKEIKINWIILQIICAGIILVIYFIVKNVSTTIKNSKIEFTGTNLKKDDGTFGTADWRRFRRYLRISEN